MEQSENYPPVDPKHKQRVLEILTELRDSYIHDEEEFGMIVILGYLPYCIGYNGEKEGDGIRYEEFIDSTMNRNLFRRPIKLSDGRALGVMYASTIGKEDDGAILVSPDGIITNSGVYLEVTPKKLLRDLDIPNNTDISTKYGFRQNVGTRHLNSIAVSGRMPTTTVFSLSESSGEIRAFEKGKIVYSSVPGEAENEKFLIVKSVETVLKKMVVGSHARYLHLILRIVR